MQAISLFKIVTNYRASYNKYSSLALNFTLTMNSYRYDQTVNQYRYLFVYNTPRSNQLN